MVFKISKFLLAIFSVIFVVVLTTFVKEEFNPDWIGYMKLYEDGAWLADSGRDLGFIALLSFLKLLTRADYNTIRLIISVYFSVFIFFLANGNLLRYGKKHVTFISIFIAIISFSCIRFSIQIREGIAVTFIIYGITILIKEETLFIGTFTNSFKKKLCTLFLFAIAGSIHSGTLPFFWLFLLSLLLDYLQNKSIKLFFKVFVYLRIFAIILAFTFPILYSYFFASNQNFYISELDNSSVKLSFGKFLYWIFEGIIIFFIRSKLLEYLKPFILLNAYTIYIKLLSDVLLIMLYIIIFLFISLQYPGSIVAALSRLLNIAMSLSILILSFNTKNSKLLFILMLFMVMEQIRVVFEALNSLDLI